MICVEGQVDPLGLSPIIYIFYTYNNHSKKIIGQILTITKKIK